MTTKHTKFDSSDDYNISDDAEPSNQLDIKSLVFVTLLIIRTAQSLCNIIVTIFLFTPQVCGTYQHPEPHLLSSTRLFSFLQSAAICLQCTVCYLSAFRFNILDYFNIVDLWNSVQFRNIPLYRGIQGLKGYGNYNRQSVTNQEQYTLMDQSPPWKGPRSGNALPKYQQQNILAYQQLQAQQRQQQNRRTFTTPTPIGIIPGITMNHYTTNNMCNIDNDLYGALPKFDHESRKIDSKYQINCPHSTIILGCTPESRDFQHDMIGKRRRLESFMGIAGLVWFLIFLLPYFVSLGYTTFLILSSKLDEISPGSDIVQQYITSYIAASWVLSVALILAWYKL